MEIEKGRVQQLRALEKTLEVSFKNIALLDQALTHSSYARSVNSGRIKDNERLEFLGDAVLELVVSESLFCKYPNCEEGDLTKIRAQFVSREYLAARAREVHLGEVLVVSDDQEQIRNQDAVLADTYEAVLGAIYLDQEFGPTKRFIRRWFTKAQPRAMEDFKSLLQEYTQLIYGVVPRYRVARQLGPEHKKKFKVHVEINGKTFGKGWGSSKKKAEKMAAKVAWDRLTGDGSSSRAA